ncbi:MAG: hypothetical protein HY292_01315 [Planctomycetes bacterium]|nr:hypothetical protein [Planctomycetota bacterium]
MKSHSLITVGSLVWMLCSCHTPSALRETVDTDGEPVRVETAEADAPEVDEATVAHRLGAYQNRKDVVERAAPAGTVEPSPDITAETMAAEPAIEDADEADEPTVSEPVLTERMAAYGGQPLGLRLVNPFIELNPAAATNVASFDPFAERHCPPQGNAQQVSTQKQNRLKNRVTTPHASDIDEEVTLDALRAPGEDHDRWSSALAVTIEGYCSDAKGTGAETCNCKKTEARLTDTHFEIVSGPNDNGLPVIAEVTPVWRLIHEHFNLEDWSSTKLRAKYRHHKVRITGWLFFDEAHLHEADNTDPGDHVGNPNWRATCWEIHPITSIEVVP